MITPQLRLELRYLLGARTAARIIGSIERISTLVCARGRLAAWYRQALVWRMPMCKTRQVALIVNGATSYDRKNIQGVVDYAREVGNWSLYVEEDPSRSTKLPDLRTWPGDGIIANFHARKVAEATCGLKIPLVRFGGRYHWGDPALAAAYFEPDNHSIARLAAGHLMDRGFTRLAYCGLPRSRTNAWSDERARAFNQLA